jgi:ankyrin repeat protein
MNAIQNNNYECVRVLVESGKCDVNARSVKQDMTPLGILSLTPHDHVQMMARLLVANGAKITDLQQRDKYNLLHLACSVGNISFVQYVLAQNTLDVNEYCAYGYTPLHYAIIMRPFEYFTIDKRQVMENYIECSKYVILAGADVRKKTRNNMWDAMSLSMKHKRTMFISQFLPLYYPRVSKLINSPPNASGKNDENIIEKLEIHGLGASPSAMLLTMCTRVIVESSQRELKGVTQEPTEEEIREAKEQYHFLEKMNQDAMKWHEQMFAMIVTVRKLVIPVLQQMFHEIREQTNLEAKKIKISHEKILYEIDLMMSKISESSDANVSFYSYFWKILSKQIGYFHETEYPVDSKEGIEHILETKLVKSSLQQKKNKKKMETHHDHNKKKQLAKELLQKKMHKLILPDDNLAFIVEMKSKQGFIYETKKFWEGVDLKEHFEHDLQKQDFTPDRRLLRLYIGLLLLHEGMHSE